MKIETMIVKLNEADKKALAVVVGKYRKSKGGKLKRGKLKVK
jgi:hypothetical protein